MSKGAKAARGTRVMKQFFMALIALVILNGCMMWAKVRFEDYRLFDVARGNETTLSQALSNLGKKGSYLSGSATARKATTRPSS